MGFQRIPLIPLFIMGLLFIKKRGKGNFYLFFIIIT